MKKNSPELVRAVHAKDAGKVRALLAAGADPNSSTKEGTPVLHHATVLASELGLEILDLLLAAGARVDQRDKTGWLPIEVASTCTSEAAVRRLLEAGANPLADTQGRVGCLQLAAWHGHPGVIAALLPYYRKPLHPHVLGIAAREWHPQAVELLLQSGADPNALASDGTTALHALLTRRPYDEPPPPKHALAIVEMLLAAGADPKIPHPDGRDVLALARALGYPEVVQTLESWMA